MVNEEQKRIEEEIAVESIKTIRMLGRDSFTEIINIINGQRIKDVNKFLSNLKKEKLLGQISYYNVCLECGLNPKLEMIKDYYQPGASSSINISSKEIRKLFTNSREIIKKDLRELIMFKNTSYLKERDFNKIRKYINKKSKKSSLSKRVKNKSEKSNESLFQKVKDYFIEKKNNKPGTKKNYGSKIFMWTGIGSLVALATIKGYFMIQDAERDLNLVNSEKNLLNAAESTYVSPNIAKENLDKEFVTKKNLEENIRKQKQNTFYRYHLVKKGENLTKIALDVLRYEEIEMPSLIVLNDKIKEIQIRNNLIPNKDNDIWYVENGELKKGQDELIDLIYPNQILDVGEYKTDYNKTKGFITSQLEKVKKNPLNESYHETIKSNLETITANSNSPAKQPETEEKELGMPDLNNMIRDAYFNNKYLGTIKKQIKNYINLEFPEKALETKIINAIETGSRFVGLYRDTFNTEFAKLSGDYDKIKNMLEKGKTYADVKNYMSNSAYAKMNISNSTIYRIKQEVINENMEKAA